MMATRDYVCELYPPPSYSESCNGQPKEMQELQNIPSQPSQITVVTILPESPPVRDHLIWSLFNTMYMNILCLGLIALVFSIKSRDMKQLGDRSGALSYGSTARSMNIAATTLSVLFCIITIIIVMLVI
ncbi:dispanin subfamily A member 2b-like [Lithobates pipiens]